MLLLCTYICMYVCTVYCNMGRLGVFSIVVVGISMSASVHGESGIH